MLELINAEIKEWLKKSAASELYAHNLYRFMANQMQRMGLFGAQKYFLKEAASELEHYQSLVDFTNDMGSVLGVPAIEAIEESVSGLNVALNIAYETEMELLNQYKEFYKEAEEKYGDCVTATFIIKYLQIQRESVGEYGDLISRLKLAGDIYEFDEYLSEL
jgi:ferritin